MTRTVAVAHDWFVNRGGAERVALSIAEAFPGAPMFTAGVMPERTFPEVAQLDLRLSELAPKMGEDFRKLLLRYPKAFTDLRADGFDTVVASSTAFAHHISTDGCLIVYCHAPPRFLWDPRYVKSSVKPWLRAFVRPVLASLRRKDAAAAGRVHRYIANSRTTAARIARTYGLRADVIPPPVLTRRFAIGPRTEEAWLMVGRLIGHRGFDLAIEAFTQMGKPLIVIGDGPARLALEAAAGDTIEFLGAVDDTELAKLYGGARGVIVPGVEDFGLVPLEANASGRPVVARAAGGALETIVDGVTGLLFREPKPSAAIEAVRRAEAMNFDPRALRAHSERFDEAVFHSRLREAVAASEACVTCLRKGNP
jgi:glycosyltransferase involved in cell wall biosynthesis